MCIIGVPHIRKDYTEIKIMTIFEVKIKTVQEK